MTVTKEMSIMDVALKYPDTIEVFMQAGMGCLGCAAARFENIAQGCEVHGIDADELVANLNKAIAKKEEK